MSAALLLKGPYLQWPTPTSVTVMWETAGEMLGEVAWFATETVHSGLSGAARTLEETRRTAAEAAPARIHRVELTGLQPDTLYHYGVVGDEALHALQTAPPRDRPFSFCVTSETGGFGDIDIDRRVFDEIERWRPDFLLMLGDAVAQGSHYDDWKRYFFGPGRRLLHTTPFYLCPGNHEEDADWMYRFTAFPAPGNYYGFDYGNTHFTSLDSTRLVDYVDGGPVATAQLAPGAAQRAFLDYDLGGAREATWRIAFFHYPPYVSGDYEVREMRQLSPSLEDGDVDLVFNSHTIVYERSHPLRDGRLDEEDGIVYIVAGGAGAKPDWLHAKRAWHTAQSHAVPHFVHVSVAGRSLELQAVDLDGCVFDRLVLRKGGERS